MFWSIVLELVDAHLRRRAIDKPGLITLAGVPYSTGNRMIIKMIEDGQIRPVPRGAGFKTHFLEPSEAMVSAIAWMASPEAMKAHVRNGFPVAPRFSVCADPEALASSPIVSMVDQLARRNQLVTWARPPIPEFNLIERTLGQQIHDADFHGKPPRQALRDAENQIHRSFSGKTASPAAK